VWGLEGAAAATLVSYTGFYVLMRLRSPVPDITAYPLPRLAVVIGGTAAIVLAGFVLMVPLALVLGALLWSLACAAVVRA
jgi:hypothetical protein